MAKYRWWKYRPNRTYFNPAPENVQNDMSTIQSMVRDALYRQIVPGTVIQEDVIRDRMEVAFHRMADRGIIVNGAVGDVTTEGMEFTIVPHFTNLQPLDCSVNFNE